MYLRDKEHVHHQLILDESDLKKIKANIAKIVTKRNPKILPGQTGVRKSSVPAIPSFPPEKARVDEKDWIYRLEMLQVQVEELAGLPEAMNSLAKCISELEKNIKTIEVNTQNMSQMILAMERSLKDFMKTMELKLQKSDYQSDYQKERIKKRWGRGESMRYDPLPDQTTTHGSGANDIISFSRDYQPLSDDHSSDSGCDDHSRCRRSDQENCRKDQQQYRHRGSEDKQRRNSASDRYSRNEPSSNKSQSYNSMVAFYQKGIQKLHEKTISIKPYQGPEIDRRSPLYFLKVFETKIAEKVDDQIAGDIFYDMIAKSEWCSPWHEKLDIDMGYERMADIFVKMEWTIEVQVLFYQQFMDSNRENTEFTNFGDFYQYWRRKLDGIDFADKFFIEHFWNNMPTRVQARVNFGKIRTLDALDNVIADLTIQELEWRELYKLDSIADRKEAIARIEAQREYPKHANTSKNKLEEPTRRKVYSNPSGYQVSTTHGCQTSHQCDHNRSN